MKPTLKVLWATAPDRLDADRAILEKLGEKDVQPFSVVGAAPADLQGQDTAVVLLPPRGAAFPLEDEGEAVKKALLAAGVPAITALRSDISEGGAQFDRKKARLVSLAVDAAQRTTTLDRLHLEDVLKEFQNPDAQDPPLYATGLEDIDRVLNGGLREGVYVVQGVPGGGKTALALFLAGSILKGNAEARVLFHSLEMSRRQVAARVLARLAYDLSLEHGRAIDMDQALFADKYAPREWDWQTPSKLKTLAETDCGARLQLDAIDAFSDFSDRFMVAYRGAGEQPSVDRLAAIGKDVTARGGCAPVVFVDYLQLITPPEEYHGERRDVVGYNSSMLEEMAHALRTPVVVLSSMNRTAVRDAQSTGRVGMGASKESGDIDYNADVILSLVDALKDGEPIEFGNAEEEGRRSGKVVEVQVAKNRTGPSTHKGNHPRLDWLNAWGVYETRKDEIALPW